MELKQSQNGRKWPICEEAEENQGNLVEWIASSVPEAQRHNTSFRKALRNFVFQFCRLWETCQNVFGSSWLFKDEQNSPWA